MWWYDFGRKDAVQDYGKKILISGLIFLVSFGPFVFPFSLSYEKKVISEIDLVSMQDSSTVSGSAHGNLFYISASVKEDDIFSFYYRLPNGGYKRDSIPASASVIFEQDNIKEAKIVQTTKFVRNKMNGTLQNILFFGVPNSNTTTYEIIVPKGSVKEGISFDASN